MPGAISFVSPSYRAASSDLTIAISPLGLVELADEEFEIHGPRMQRYANDWAWYLGIHYGYRREIGEPQLTINYTKTFADFIINFIFGRGVSFNSPKETEAIVPSLLQRVWEEDNPKDLTIREIALNGGVSGDSFVKVAYEDQWQDPAGNTHPGRVRILPINSAYAFPEWYPHDHSRLERFKMKYRFWGTGADGTRQVYTLVELWTEAAMEIYINDEQVYAEDNLLGVIPFVHIPNALVPSSPWGMSDIQNITDLNRQYNETATQICDIVNYYSSPVTVITGAKSAQLERGAKKVFAIPDKDAKIQNLELNDDLAGPLALLDRIKMWMHEITGVPETALGQMQPISNTSGVALSIMYTPLLNRAKEKWMLYGYGFQRINELILRTLALWEPESLIWDPNSDTPLKEGQVNVLDPANPVTYKTTVTFASPLPVDQLIALNEIVLKMQLGLESKRGALQILGEAYPDEKLQELMDELYEDALWQGGLDLLKAQISQMVMMVTGVPTGPMAENGTAAPGGPQSVPSAGGPDVNSGPGAAGFGGTQQAMQIGDDAKEKFSQLSQIANGARLAQYRNPRKETTDQ